MTILSEITKVIEKEFEETKTIVPLVLSKLPAPIREDAGLKLMMRVRYLAKGIIDYLKYVNKVDPNMKNEKFCDRLYDDCNERDGKLVYELNILIKVCEDYYYLKPVVIRLEYDDLSFNDLTYIAVAKYVRYMEFKIVNVMNRIKEWEDSCKE